MVNTQQGKPLLISQIRKVPFPFLLSGFFLFPMAVLIQKFTQNLGNFTPPEIPEITFLYPPLLFHLDILFITLGLLSYLFWGIFKRKKILELTPISQPMILGIDVLGVFCCFLLFQMIYSRLMVYWVLQFQGEVYPTLCWGNSLILLSIAVVILLMVPLTWKCRFSDFGLNFRLKMLIVVLFAYLWSYPLLFALEFYLNPEQKIVQPLARYFLLGKATLSMKFQTVLIVPIVEEILFRGVFLPWMSQLAARFSSSPKKIAIFSIVGSAFLFALVHGESLIFLQIFFLGLILGWLRVYFNSLAPCILFHLLHNGWTCIKFEIVSRFLFGSV